MAQVKWQNTNLAVSVVYFDDLDDNASFKIRTSRSRGAVYRKVYHKESDSYFMMEEATGKLFDPTDSPVEEVCVSVSIDQNRPSIY